MEPTNSIVPFPPSGHHENLFKAEMDMEAAIRDWLVKDPLLTLEYREAMAHAPALVARESPRVAFWRTEGGNAIQGAARLCRYWKVRKWLFQERWLLPMTQTGRGALDELDVAILRSGI